MQFSLMPREFKRYLNMKPFKTSMNVMYTLFLALLFQVNNHERIGLHIIRIFSPANDIDVKQWSLEKKSCPGVQYIIMHSK